MNCIVLCVLNIRSHIYRLLNLFFTLMIKNDFIKLITSFIIVRRRNLTPGRINQMAKPAPPPAAYALALPRSLYGDDINGNTSNMMMTQSMDPAHLAARLDNNATPTVLQTPQVLHGQDLMTASLDPSLLSGFEALQVKINCINIELV